MSEIEIVSESEQRRKSFTSWLVQAWEWALDNGDMPLATKLALLIECAGENDFPLWEKARQYGIIGDTALADRMRNVLGLPLQGPERTGWEKEIRFSPIIYLDEDQWKRIYNALGWANRDSDANVNAVNFVLWSPQGNAVRFVMRKEQIYEQRATEEDS